MTASVQPETTSSSRRALLAGALGGLGAWAASAIGRASPVRGAEGEAVFVGGDYTATTATGFTTTTASALLGISDSAVGVTGSSSSYIGVYGNSSTGTGIRGSSLATDQPAIFSKSFGDSTAVLGVSGGADPTAKPKTGVYGYANQDSTASAVYGLSPLGVAIRGHTASGYAGYFEGRVYTNAFYELGEVATPAAPLANRARLFVRDSAGKTQLCVRFHTGAVQVIKTEL